MLKNEIKKCFLDGTIWISLILIVFGVVYIFADFYVNSTNSDYPISGYGIEKYDSEEDLIALRDRIKAELLEDWGDPERDDRLRTLLNIYDLLIEKDIAYHSIVDYVGVSVEKRQNGFSFFRFSIILLKTILSLSVGIFASLIVVTDFQRGTYKFLYTRNVSRLKVIWYKAIWVMVFCALAVLVSASICAIFGFNAYDNSGIKYIIIANQSGAKVLNPLQFICLDTAILLQYTAFYSVLIFSLSLFLKNSVVSVLLNGAVYVLIFICYLIDNIFVLNASQGIFSVFEFASSSNSYIGYAMGIYIVVIALITVLSVLSFRRRDFG